MRKTRSEHLQALWDADDTLMVASVVFRPFRGWYAEPHEGRYFGDDGEFLGDNWRDAEAAIRWLRGER